MTRAVSAPTRPALRWHGGKWRLAPWVIGHLPPHRVYVEPFGGAASVLLRKPRSHAEVYNDLDGDVVTLFRVLRDPVATARLVDLVWLTPFSREEHQAAYGPADDDVERARRLIVRSFMGFGSHGHARRTGFRSNSDRSGTTPAGDWKNYPAQLRLVAERWRGVVVENKAASAVIADHDGPTTVFYVDPPYMAGTRDRGRDYAHELTDADHAALLDQLKGLAGMVVLSGYACPLYDEALAGWARSTMETHADGARDRTEVLWLNPAAAAATPAQQRLELVA